MQFMAHYRLGSGDLQLKPSGLLLIAYIQLYTRRAGDYRTVLYFIRSAQPDIIFGIIMSHTTEVPARGIPSRTKIGFPA